jgi:DNA-binding response OmpR family regulator
MSAKPRILLIDDDRTTLLVTAALLEQRGYFVIQRQDALGSGLAIARENPDLVLLDVNMPGLSGDKIAQLSIARRKGDGPAIFLFSAMDPETLSAMAAECGAAGAIEKTSDPSEFLARFDSALAASGYQPDLRRLAAPHARG